MTLPDERYRAIQQTQRFLLRLLSTPRVPKAVKDEARGLLRHYPTDYDMQQLEHAAPNVIQQRMEPVHRMIAAYTAATPEHDDHEGSTLD
jgi:hypothetical protein